MKCSSEHKGTFVCSHCGFGLFRPELVKQPSKATNTKKAISLLEAWNKLLDTPAVGDVMHEDSLIRIATNNSGPLSSFKIACGKCETPLGEEQNSGNGFSSRFNLKAGSIRFVPLKP